MLQWPKAHDPISLAIVNLNGRTRSFRAAAQALPWKMHPEHRVVLIATCGHVDFGSWRLPLASLRQKFNSKGRLVLAKEML